MNQKYYKTVWKVLCNKVFHFNKASLIRNCGFLFQNLGSQIDINRQSLAKKTTRKVFQVTCFKGCGNSAQEMDKSRHPFYFAILMNKNLCETGISDLKNPTPYYLSHTEFLFIELCERLTKLSVSILKARGCVLKPCTLIKYSTMSQLKLIIPFYSELIILSLGEFEPWTTPVTSPHSNHWAMTTWLPEMG